MFQKWFRKDKIGLLPYISEPVYGLSPNDPQTLGWEIKKFRIEKSWIKSSGEGVVCAVLDTGCDLDHADLSENLLDGKNFIDKNDKPIDKNGHGTHVSSTIAAVNNSKGIVGVAPKTKILPVKVLSDSGNGSVISVVDGIYWASDISQVNFITMSLGSKSPNKDIDKALNYAVSKNKIVFCAAGNSGPGLGIMYPAKYNTTIAIGAIDENLMRTPFSCSGDELDFLAPGNNILGCVPGNKYSIMSGTSMSNPFAVGIASLLLSSNMKNYRYSLESKNDYIDLLKKHTIKLADDRYPSTKEYQGYGIIQPIN
jgi:subtilisin family serine protease